MGPENVRLENVGLENVGPENVRLENVGLENVGPENVGLENVGLENAELKNVGPKNAGLENAGLENAGPVIHVTRKPFCYSSQKVILVLYRNSAFPVLYVLMSCKSQALYQKVSETLKNLVREFTPTSVMADFEEASLSAF